MEQICEDCGERIAEGAGCCPKCGLVVGEGVPQVKMIEIGKCRSPYVDEYLGLREGEETNAFVLEMEDRADNGDAMAQHFLATEVYSSDTNPKRVFELLKEASDSGNHFAENSLALMYGLGEGVRKDVVAAMRLFRRAAKKGNPIAMLNLGRVYAGGEGVRRDAAKAISCFEQALASGMVEAAKVLSGVYEFGEGVPKDDVKAVKYLKIAAEKDDAESMYVLSKFYFEGTGVERDVGSSLMWCRSAADLGWMPAQMMMALHYELGEHVRKDPAEAVRWFEKASASGSTEAKLKLSVAYDLGIGCERNPARSFYLAMSALDAGDKEALWNVSHCYRQAVGVKTDIEKADRYLFEALDADVDSVWYPRQPETAVSEFESRMRWAGEDAEKLRNIHLWMARSECDGEEMLKPLLKASDMGDPWSMAFHGEQLIYGDGVEKDVERGVAMLEKAAQSGSVACAWNMLGKLFASGEKVPVDYERAYDCFSRGAEAGDGEAYKDLSVLVGHGLGCPQDGKRAHELMVRAAELGSETAKRNLEDEERCLQESASSAAAEASLAPDTDPVDLSGGFKCLRWWLRLIGILFGLALLQYFRS